MTSILSLLSVGTFCTVLSKLTPASGAAAKEMDVKSIKKMNKIFFIEDILNYSSLYC